MVVDGTLLFKALASASVRAASMPALMKWLPSVRASLTPPLGAAPSWSVNWPPPLSVNVHGRSGSSARLIGAASSSREASGSSGIRRDMAVSSTLIQGGGRKAAVAIRADERDRYALAGYGVINAGVARTLTSGLAAARLGGVGLSVFAAGAEIGQALLNGCFALLAVRWIGFALRLQFRLELGFTLLEFFATVRALGAGSLNNVIGRDDRGRRFGLGLRAGGEGEKGGGEQAAGVFHQASQKRSGMTIVSVGAVSRR